MLPQQQLKQIGAQTGVDRSVSHLKGDLMVKLLLFGMLRSDRLSTRVLEEFYNSPLFNDFSGKGPHQTRHSSLASRLSTMEVDYFKQLFEWTAQQFSNCLPKGRFHNSITRFDSTLCAISSSLVEWGMKVGRKPKEGPQQVQVKFSVGLKNYLPSSGESFLDQEHLSEETALKEAIQKASPQADELVVFDMGLKNRKVLQVFDEQGLHFVTRATANVRYQLLEPHRLIKGRSSDGLVFVQDSKVHLYASGHECVAHPFRLIEATLEETGQVLFFVTNMWDLSAMEIARIYRRRWDIEVFFRFLKQQLNLKHLLNHSHNGIQIQLYATLMAAILLLVYKHKQNIASYKIAKIRFEDELLLLLTKQLAPNQTPFSPASAFY